MIYKNGIIFFSLKNFLSKEVKNYVNFIWYLNPRCSYSTLPNFSLRILLNWLCNISCFFVCSVSRRLYFVLKQIGIFTHSLWYKINNRTYYWYPHKWTLLSNSNTKYWKKHSIYRYFFHFFLFMYEKQDRKHLY